MSIIEENGQKLAAVLCVASCFPVVATVYAMETESGIHGDEYVAKATTAVAKGWQEIEGKAYYFTEENKTNKVAAVSETNINTEVAKQQEESVVAVNVDITEAVQEVIKEVPAVEEAVEAQETVVVDELEVVEETVIGQEAVLEQETFEEEVPVEEEIPVVEEVQVEEQAPIYEEAPQPEYVEEIPVVEEAPVENIEAIQFEEVPEPEYVEVTPVVEEAQPEYVESSNPYSQLNAAIASTAQSLVGVTDGQWCTEVVQQALSGAGVQDAYQLWPDQYADQYGYYTSDPQAGNLVYYYNGGRGVDHIAVYIGDGMAVHGNYNGKTVVETVYVPGGAPQYIQVCR